MSTIARQAPGCSFWATSSAAYAARSSQGCVRSSREELVGQSQARLRGCFREDPAVPDQASPLVQPDLNACAHRVRPCVVVSPRLEPDRGLFAGREFVRVAEVGGPGAAAAHAALLPPPATGGGAA